MSKIVGMRHFNKDRLLQVAWDHIDMVRKKIAGILPDYRKQIAETETKFYRLSPEKQMVAMGVLKTLDQKVNDLGLLYPSPYFIKCIVTFDTDSTDRIFYFSKLPLPEESIYSWTAPAAVLRFTDPGKFEYKGGNVKPVKGTLKHKEQYLITNGRIVFMAAESQKSPRELIYQEHFSKRKTEFTLPEIVEQMEAAQDKAIRTPPTKSLLIFGPAGSGKTTLALHRIAYLLQAPDTAEKFSAEKTLVLVNDHNTRQYFAQLLPELGIVDVTITTFNDFVLTNLNLAGYKDNTNTGENTLTSNLFVYQKHQALTQTEAPTYTGNVYEILTSVYQPFFNAETESLWHAQQTGKFLDRFDLTLLLASYFRTHKNLSTSEVEYKQLKGGKVSRKTIKTPLFYSLVLLDEIQNYLPKQIELIKKTLSPNGSTIYVGDLAQQTKLFTARQWVQVGEQLSDNNTILLQKVYRSTKQILKYIAAQGYPVHVPEDAREGKQVTTYHYTNTTERDAYIEKVIAGHADVTVGILAASTNDVYTLVQKYTNNPKIKILSIPEAQGVEFDIVVLCNVDELFNTDLTGYPADLASQVEQVNRDLIYVGLTRAMNELHILDKQQT